MKELKTKYMIKRLFYLSCIVIIAINCTDTVSSTEDTAEDSTKWSTSDRQRYLANREDSTTWDWQLFKEDLSFLDFDLGLPFKQGAFPVSDYALAGSFNGVGNYGYPGGEGYEKKIADKTLLFNSFFVGKNGLNETIVKEHTDEIFFHIVVLTDYIDTVEYKHLSSAVVSRNHPDYIGQGFYKTKNNQIDYSAFLTAERNAYAIINMRLFDLTAGKTILIAPQKDRSLRTMQIESPLLSSKTIDKYTDDLLKEAAVKAFFTQENNI